MGMLGLWTVLRTTIEDKVSGSTYFIAKWSEFLRRNTTPAVHPSITYPARTKVKAQHVGYYLQQKVPIGSVFPVSSPSRSYG